MTKVKVDPNDPNLNRDVHLLNHLNPGCISFCFGQVNKMGVDQNNVFDEDKLKEQIETRKTTGELSQEWQYTTKTRYYGTEKEAPGDYKKAHSTFKKRIKENSIHYVGYNEYTNASETTPEQEISSTKEVKTGKGNQLTRTQKFDSKESAIVFMDGLQKVLDAIGHHSNNIVEFHQSGAASVTLEMHTHGAKDGPGLTVADITACAIVDAYIKYPTIKAGIEEVERADNQQTREAILRQLLYAHQLDVVKGETPLENSTLYKTIQNSSAKAAGTALLRSATEEAKFQYNEQALQKF